MKTKKVEGTGGEVDIPLTPNGWELYNQAGCEQAARRLAHAAEEAVKAPTRGEAITIMSRALKADMAFGATDTEPRCIAETILNIGRGGNFNWAL